MNDQLKIILLIAVALYVHEPTSVWFGLYWEKFQQKDQP